MKVSGSNNLFHAIFFNEVQRFRQTNSELVTEAMFRLPSAQSNAGSNITALGS